MFSDTEKEEITKILKKRSRFVWTDKKCEEAIKVMERFKSGERDLEEKLPQIAITYRDFYFERDLLKFVESSNKGDP